DLIAHVAQSSGFPPWNPRGGKPAYSKASRQNGLGQYTESDGAGRVRHNVAAAGRFPSRLVGILWVYDMSAAARLRPIFNRREEILQASWALPDESQSHQHLTELRFSDLPLSAELQRGIAEAGFERCTPFQSKSLTVTLARQDVAGQAQTGTGKT